MVGTAGWHSNGGRPLGTSSNFTIFPSNLCMAAIRKRTEGTSALHKASWKKQRALLPSPRKRRPVAVSLSQDTLHRITSQVKYVQGVGFWLWL